METVFNAVFFQPATCLFDGVTVLYAVEGGHELVLYKDIIATESTKGHEKMSFKAFILPCFSVDSVAILFFDGY